MLIALNLLIQRLGMLKSTLNSISLCAINCFCCKYGPLRAIAHANVIWQKKKKTVDQLRFNSEINCGYPIGMKILIQNAIVQHSLSKLEYTRYSISSGILTPSNWTRYISDIVDFQFSICSLSLVSWPWLIFWYENVTIFLIFAVV